MQAQTVAQIKATTAQESLWDFLSHLPASMEAQVLYAMILFGLIGMCMNWLVKWTRHEVEVNGWLYFTGNFRYTLGAVLGMGGTALTAISMGVFNTAEGSFVGWLNVIWTASLNGFMWDATVNKVGGAKDVAVAADGVKP